MDGVNSMCKLIVGQYHSDIPMHMHSDCLSSSSYYNSHIACIDMKEGGAGGTKRASAS